MHIVMMVRTCDFCGAQFDTGNLRYWVSTPTDKVIWDSCSADFTKAMSTAQADLLANGPLYLRYETTR